MAAAVRGKPARAPQPRGDAFVRVVLETTLAQLAEVGFERLSIPAIAELAGVNKTSVYRRWPSKSELVHDALAVAMRHVDAAPDTGELRGDLLALARTVAEFVQSPVGAGILRVLLAEGASPEVRALASAAYRDADQRIPRAAITRAVARGELAESVDPRVLLFTIAGAIVHRVFIERGRATQPFLEQVVDLVLYGATRAKRPAKR